MLAEVLQRLEREELAIVERAFELVALGVQRADPAAAAALAVCGPKVAPGEPVVVTGTTTANEAATVKAVLVASTAPAANEAMAANTTPTASVS